VVDTDATRIDLSLPDTEPDTEPPETVDDAQHVTQKEEEPEP